MAVKQPKQASDSLVKFFEKYFRGFFFFFCVSDEEDDLSA